MRVWRITNPTKLSPFSHETVELLFSILPADFLGSPSRRMTSSPPWLTSPVRISVLSGLTLMAWGFDVTYRSNMSQYNISQNLCRAQHVVSVESLSLFHHSIYLWFICFPWWSIDEVENLNADRTTNYMFWAITEAEGKVGIPKLGLSPTPSIAILTVPMRYFCCGSLLLLVLAVRIFTLVHLLCEWHILVKFR